MSLAGLEKKGIKIITVMDVVFLSLGIVFLPLKSLNSGIIFFLLMNMLSIFWIFLLLFAFSNPKKEASI